MPGLLPISTHSISDLERLYFAGTGISTDLSYWQQTFTKDGCVYKDAEVSIYKAGTDEPARVFDEDGDLRETAPQLMTDGTGFVRFGLDPKDYFTGQLFDVKCTSGHCSDKKEIFVPSLMLLDDSEGRRFLAAEAGADKTADQFTRALGEIESSTVNFNKRNDRNSDAVVEPTIAADGTAIDHTENTDGSVDISFEWSWGGTEADIDGFVVYLRGSTGSSSYTMGSSPAEEQTLYCRPDRRAIVFKAMAADLYYTFGVQAYRVVDPDIDATGAMESSIVQPSIAGEDPYQPDASVAFSGDVQGTINSKSSSAVLYHNGTKLVKTDDNSVNADDLDEGTTNKWAAESGAVRNFSSINDDGGTLTIASSKLLINTNTGIEVEADISGGITLKKGADILMNAESQNPAALKFLIDSANDDYVLIGADPGYWDNALCIWNSENSSCSPTVNVGLNPVLGSSESDYGYSWLQNFQVFAEFINLMAVNEDRDHGSRVWVKNYDDSTYIEFYSKPGSGHSSGGAIVIDPTDGVLIKEQSSQPGSSSTGTSLYSYDVSGTIELRVVDSAGNRTTLSPHGFHLFEPDPSYEFPWSFYHENEFIGRRMEADMFGALRALETLAQRAGLENSKFIYIEEMEEKDWDADQAHKEQIAGTYTVPEGYTQKPMPKWLKTVKDRKNAARNSQLD